MKIAIFSDLHIEFGEPWSPPEDLDYDVLILAGDVNKHTYGITHHLASRKPVIYVAGNHEFYGGHLFGILAELRRAAPLAMAEHGQIPVFFLENDAVVINGVRFLGTTLWTDYGLFDQATYRRYMAEAESCMNDHRLISLSGGAPFRPSHARDMHLKARAWLDQTLAQPFNGPTVVVTHHLPAPGSVAPQFRFDPLTPAFASDLTELIERHQPELWIHGHTHRACDYYIGRTRILCNPRGYPREPATRFNPNLVIELDTLDDLAEKALESTARASAAIDDAVSSVEASNARIEALERGNKERSRIVSNAQILDGTFVIEGTRVPAENVLAEVREGVSEFDIFRHYPSLPPDAIEVCLAWKEAWDRRWEPTIRDFLETISSAAAVTIVLPDIGVLVELAARRQLELLTGFHADVHLVVTDVVEYESAVHRIAPFHADRIKAFVEANLDRIRIDPTTFAELLAYAKKNPGTAVPEDAGWLSIYSYIGRITPWSPGEPLIAILEDRWFLSHEVKPLEHAKLLSLSAFLAGIERCKGRTEE